MRNFKKYEFNCKCGCGLGFKDMDSELLSNLEQARNICTEPFIISSSIRCSKHNFSINGVMDSMHLKGKAVDIVTNDSKQRFSILESLIVFFPRIGIYKDFIHVDVKDEYRVWL